MWRKHVITCLAFCAAVTGLASSNAALADANYSITDGAAEVALGIDAGETQVWFNTFPVNPAGPSIDTIGVAYGRLGGPSALNGLPVTILLYEDQNGGSPQDAVLKFSLNTTVTNGNTNTLNQYAVPSIFIRRNLAVGVLYHNTTLVRKFIGALDTTAPSPADRSYAGFVVGTLDPSDLSAIPADQFGTLEGRFGIVGNVRVVAHGRGPTCATIRGDLDNDGQVNSLDVQCFVDCSIKGVTGSCGSGCPCTDMDQDGDLDDCDLCQFVQALLGLPSADCTTAGRCP